MLRTDKSYKVTRTFHPIGQGAFYSERHSAQNRSINIVYDCGAKHPLSNYAKGVAENAFKNEIIDILFISHFDYDHVSCIAQLKKHAKKIKYVVLPLLDKAEKALLVNVNRALSNNILTLIDNPQRYFGDKTKVISVRAVSDDDGDRDEVPDDDRDDKDKKLPEYRDGNLFFDGDDEWQPVINSGTEMSFGFPFQWIFVPYNYQDKTRTEQLKQRLSAHKELDFELMTSSTKYTIEQIIKPASRKALRKIYDKDIDGTVNENSMCLYSGPYFGCEIYFDFEYSFTCYFGEKIEEKIISIAPIVPGCLYTGDFSLKVNTPEKLLKKYGFYIGTVQLPHHGSKDSYEFEEIQKVHSSIYDATQRYFEKISDFNHLAFESRYGPLQLPVSYGLTNTYGHPAIDVLNQLLCRDMRPVCITEKPESIYKQVIEFEDLKYKDFVQQLKQM